jgi:hypothetical protein
MDSDDFVPLVITCVVAIIAWSPWYHRAMNTFAPNCAREERGLLLAAPIALAIMFFGTLGFVADRQVAESVGYRVMYTALALVTMRMLTGAVHIFGLDAIDALQQRNRAVTIAIGAIWVAAVIVNLGANIGSGDTIVSTFEPSALGTVILAAFIALLTTVTHLNETICSARLSDAGWRFAGYVLAAALPVARGASGDWTTPDATFWKLVHASSWLPVLLVAACVVEWRWSRNATVSRPWTRGIVPAVILVACAATITWWPQFHSR